MRRYKFIGYFKDGTVESEFRLVVHCNGYAQAFILLTADAIRKGRHYQLDKIQNEEGEVKVIDKDFKIVDLIK